MSKLKIAILAAIASVCAMGQGQYPGSAHVNLYFPQLADGGPQAARWQTVITLVSQSLLDGDVTIQLYDNAGKAMTLDFGEGALSTHKVRMPGFGSKTLASRMKSETTQVGWAIVKSDVPMSGLATFRLWLDGKATQEVSAPPVLPTFTYSSYANKELGVAIANPSSTVPITVRALMGDSLGWPSGKAVDLTIPAMGHTVFNIKDKFAQVDMSDWTIMLYAGDVTSPFVAWTLSADASVQMAPICVRRPNETEFSIFGRN